MKVGLPKRTGSKSKLIVDIFHLWFLKTEKPLRIAAMYKSKKYIRIVFATQAPCSNIHNVDNVNGTKTLCRIYLEF
jgi:hypothetical protein